MCRSYISRRTTETHTLIPYTTLVLSNATVSYAGGNGWGAVYAYVTGNTQPSLSAVNFTDNTIGLFINGPGTNTSVTGSTFARNAGGDGFNPVSIGFCMDSSSCKN